jgi:hypothetical protein
MNDDDDDDDEEYILLECTDRWLFLSLLYNAV